MKKIIFINALITFALCFLTHFLYDLFPNTLFSFLFPVNESIWEHMKMIYTTILLYGIIEYFILKKFNYSYESFILPLFIKSIIAIPIYLAMYYPLRYLFGEVMFITFTLLLLTFVIVNYLSYKFIMPKKFPYEKLLSIVGIVTIYIIMIILTYKTPHLEIFFDTEEEKYGINDYLIKD